MKGILNISNIYIVLWLLFDWVSLFYPGSFLSRVLMIAITLISFYYLFHVISKARVYVLFKSIVALIAMFLVYGIVLMGSLGGNNTWTSFLLSIFTSFLPLFVFYSFAKDGMLSEKTIFFLLIVYVIYCTYSYNLLEASILSVSKKDETTNNRGYWFLMLIPLIAVCDKKRTWQFGLLLYCLSYVVLSMKRGAIVCGVLCYVMFVAKAFRNAKGGKKFWNFLLSVIVVVVVYYVVNNLLASSEYFNQRFESTMEGDSSGRYYYYSRVWQAFKYESNLFQMLFGHGIYSTIALLGNAAHSDWLELLYCNGLFGVVMYLFYWIALLITWRKTRADKKASMIIGLFFIVFFTRSLFSMSYALIPEYANMALGYALAKAELNSSTV